jgi:hypothetical protein
MTGRRSAVFRAIIFKIDCAGTLIHLFKMATPPNEHVGANVVLWLAQMLLLVFGLAL